MDIGGTKTRWFCSGGVPGDDADGDRFICGLLMPLCKAFGDILAWLGLKLGIGVGSSISLLDMRFTLFGIGETIDGVNSLTFSGFSGSNNSVRGCFSVIEDSGVLCDMK